MTAAVPPTDWAEVLERGLVALPEAIATVDDVTRSGGERVLALRLAGGLSFDVLPDRGLDLGATWWAGVPVAWRSPHLVDPGPGHGWEDRFLGGLLATCGPDNIGAPRDGHGQHGSHHLTPATGVRWWRELTPDGVMMHVAGAVGRSTLDGERVVVEREIVATTGVPAVEVRDVVRNEGTRPAGVPLLYHVNLGAPLLSPGSRLHVDAEEPVVREPLPPGRDPLVAADPAPGLDPVVAEHPDVRAVDGTARAVLAGAGAEVVVTWTADTLPRLCTWSFPAQGVWVLGVEPTNAALFGPERDLPDGGAPVLAPGAEWRTGVRIEVVPVGTGTGSM